MKPEITFFGEALPEAFFKAMAKDVDRCDLVVVVGTSLKVRHDTACPHPHPVRHHHSPPVPSCPVASQVGGSVHHLLRHVGAAVPQVRYLLCAHQMRPRPTPHQ